MPENSKDEYAGGGKGALLPMHKRWRHHAAEQGPKRDPETGDRARLLLGWGRELGGKVLALIDLLLGSATRNLKTPHTRTKASAWGEGRSKLGLGTLRAETAPIKQMRRPFLGTLTSGDTTAGIERPRGALGVAGGGQVEPWPK